MEAPIEPTLKDFGLTPEDLQTLPELGRRPRVIALGLFIIGTLYFMEGHWFEGKSTASALISTIFRLIQSGFFALFPALFAVLILEWMESKIQRARHPKLILHQRYKQALIRWKHQRQQYDLWLIRQSKAHWRSLNGIDFEKEVGRLYQRLGFQVSMTPTTGDGGVDLLLRKDGRLTVVQCKAHQKKVPIGVARELAAAMRDFKADAAIIACLEGVTKPVRDYIQDKPIHIVDLDDLIRMHQEAQSR